MMAYITRYIFGTDKLRPNAFEVRGMNGSNTGGLAIILGFKTWPKSDLFAL